MTNNKTQVLDNDEKTTQKPSEIMNSPRGRSLSSLSSNKTTILSDELQNNVSRSQSAQNSDEINSYQPSQKEKSKSFSSYFKCDQPNELLGHATPILSFINRIRTLKEYDMSIYQTATELLNEYINNLKKTQIKPDILQAASYILCMTVDEVALKCSWSYASPWISHGILDTFFQQSQDDGYFTGLLEYHLAQQSKNKDKDVLEIFGVCLSICTQGNNSNKAAIKYENLRHKILASLKNHYPTDNSSHFSPHAVPADQIKKQMANSIPLWIIGIISILVLICIYIGFRVALSLTTEPVYNRINQLYLPNTQIDSSRSQK